MKKIQMRPDPLIGTEVEKTGYDVEERKRSTIAACELNARLKLWLILIVK